MDFLKGKILSAMKSGDKVLASSLRVISGELARAKTKEYTIEDVYAQIRKSIKNLEAYPTATSQAEIEALRSVLPKEPSHDEIAEAIKHTISIGEAIAACPTASRETVAKIWKTLNAG